MPNGLAAELRAEGPSAPAACSPAAGVEHAALRREPVPPDRLRSGGTQPSPGARFLGDPVHGMVIRLLFSTLSLEVHYV